MMKINRVLVDFIGAVVMILAGMSQSVLADERPNFILLMGDDHGWDETGYNGHPYLKTPVLDEMAAQGLRLNRFYAAHPTCSPTRGSVLTGRHPNRYGTFTPNYSIRPEEVTIAHLLSDTGYRCGHFGKWHLGPVKLGSPTNPGAMGFHEWLSHDNFFEINPILSRNGDRPEQIRGESSEIIVDEAIRFIRSANRKPFFVVVWFGSPHEPYSGLSDDLALYDAIPGKFNDREVRLTSNETGKPTVRPLGDVLRERYAEITAMDRSIGRLRNWLDQAGLRDNTLLWYCGDNGSPSGASVTTPLRGQKATMYEGGIRVPGILEWPAKISHPLESEVTTVTSDILPTLCRIAGVDKPDRPMDGIDLTAVIEDRIRERATPVFFWRFDTKTEMNRSPYIPLELQAGTTPLVKMMNGLYTRNFHNFHHNQIAERDYGGQRVIMEKQYKLVVMDHGDGIETEELFDVRADPAERNNLFELNPARARAMVSRLRIWQQSVLTSLTGADYRR